MALTWEIPLNKGRDGVGDGPDTLVRGVRCRQCHARKDVTSPTILQTAAKRPVAFQNGGASWLRQCATGREVPGWIRGGVLGKFQVT